MRNTLLFEKLSFKLLQEVVKTFSLATVFKVSDNFIAFEGNSSFHVGAINLYDVTFNDTTYFSFYRSRYRTGPVFNTRDKVI